jgi:WD40 repeat protein
VRLWDVASRQVLQQFPGHQARIGTVAFHPQGQLIATGGQDGLVEIWNLESGECVATLATATNNVMSVSFSSDGRFLASSCHFTIQVWNVSTQQCLQTLNGHSNTVSAVMFQVVPFHDAGEVLVSASYDETIRFWDVKTGECLRSLRPVRVASALRNRLYEGMDITGVTGLTEGAIATLKSLGAVEK